MILALLLNLAVVATASDGRLANAIRAGLEEGGLDVSAIHIEVDSSSPAQLPPGELRFRWDALGKSSVSTPKAMHFWSGQLRESTGRTSPVWVRARIWQVRPALRAVQALATGRTLAEGDIELAPAEVSLFEAKRAAQPERWIGRKLRRGLGAGQILSEEYLAPAFDVAAGTSVSVISRSGAARLELSAKAETGGRQGDWILCRNPENGRRFRARVTGPGAALVVVE